MNDWLAGMLEMSRRAEPSVLVTVVKTRGSTPREPGARMAVGLNEVHDTIGGGQLEHAAIESARLMIEQPDGAGANQLERHALSPALGQCCGGVAWLLLEPVPADAAGWIERLAQARRERTTVYIAVQAGGRDRYLLEGADAAGTALPAAGSSVLRLAAAAGGPVFDPASGWFVDCLSPPDFNVVLFGAGHVGRALAGVLATLPCSLTWVDSRDEPFPPGVGANVRTVAARDPAALVEECPPGSFYLVMTHSHPLDFEICERILARGDFAYCGLIGSISKRRSFEKRVRLKGITESALNRLTCPIGVAGASGKRPAEIAVAAAAEVLQARDALPAAATRDVPNTG